MSLDLILRQARIVGYGDALLDIGAAFVYADGEGNSASSVSPALTFCPALTSTRAPSGK